MEGKDSSIVGRAKKKWGNSQLCLIGTSFIGAALLTTLQLFRYDWNIQRLLDGEFTNYRFQSSTVDVALLSWLQVVLIGGFIRRAGLPASRVALLAGIGAEAFLMTKLFLFQEWKCSGCIAIIVLPIIITPLQTVLMRKIAEQAHLRSTKTWHSIPYITLDADNQDVSSAALLAKTTDADEEGAPSEDDIDESKPFWRTCVQFFKILKPYFWPSGWKNRSRAGSTWVVLGASKACNLVAPLYMGKATNSLSNGDLHSAQIEVTILCCLMFAAKALKELQSFVYLAVKQTAFIQISEMAFNHIHSLSLQWYLSQRMGTTVRAIDRGVISANSVVSYIFLYLAPTIVESIIVCFIFASHFGIPTLAIAAFSSVVLYGVVTVCLTLWRRKFREGTNKHDNEYHEKLTDSLVNFETVKYFGNEKFEAERFSEAIRKYQSYSVSTSASLNVLNASQQLLFQTALAISLLICAPYVVTHEHKMTIGGFVAVSVYMANMFQPLNFLGTIINMVTQAVIDIQNLSELLGLQTTVNDKKGAPRLFVPPPESGAGVSVEFRDVFFHYPKQPIGAGLRGVSFTVAPDSVTALVGSSGAGKTTIARLLFRFFDVHQGAIFVNGQNIAEVRQDSLRRALGVVPQDTVLFNESILHNIIYGNLNASMEEVRRACKDAQILEFIESLPDQWETKVGERGLKLSGGEKQRVAIARTLLKNPPIVILDEATSALDSVTEKEIQLALRSLSINRTMLVIAHRLSTVKKAKQIVVLDSGRVVEKGDHSTLISQNGMYAKLWRMQAHSQVEGPDSPKGGSDILVQDSEKSDTVRDEQASSRSDAKNKGDVSGRQGDGSKEKGQYPFAHKD